MKVLLLFAMVLVPALQSELKILDTPDGGIRPAPCAVTCSGVGRWNDENNNYKWQNSRINPGKVFKFINIGNCNFVSAPVVTTTSVSMKMAGCPAVSVWYLTESYVTVYSVQDTSAKQMRSDECDIHWSAFGFNC